MSEALFTQTLAAAAGAFLLCAVLVLWRRELAAIVRLLGAQGVALAALVAIVGAHERAPELLAVAAGLALLKAGLLPALLRRALAAGGEARETQPLVNVAASLLAAAALTLVAYAVTRPLVAVDPGPATAAVPVGVTVVLIGLLVLLTRRRAMSQVVGFLLVDNGISAVAFLAAGGVPLVVELGVALDVLFAVLVLQVLTARMWVEFGDTDLDELRELHD